MLRFIRGSKIERIKERERLSLFARGEREILRYGKSELLYQLVDLKLFTHFYLLPALNSSKISSESPFWIRLYIEWTVRFILNSLPVDSAQNSSSSSLFYLASIRS